MTEKNRPFKDKKLASEAGKKSSKKGKMHKETLIRLNLAERLEDFDQSLYDWLMTMLKFEEPTTSKSTKFKIEKLVGKKIDGKSYNELVQTISNSVRLTILRDIETKKFAVKELLKYRVPQKKEITGNVYGQIVFQAHPDILSGDEEKFANVNPES